MVTIFDDHGLAPQFLMDWVSSSQNNRNPNDIGWRSVTELIGPPKPKLISERLGDTLQVPASSKIDAMIGDAVHRDIAQFVSRLKNAKSEKRLHVSLAGKKISGQTDAIIDNTLYDFKTRKASQHAKGYTHSDELQLNCYVYLCAQNNIKIDEAIIISLCKNKASFDDFYSYEFFNIPIWTEEQQHDFLVERIKIHEEADNNYYQFGALPSCTDNERWITPTTYKVRRFDWDEDFRNGKRPKDIAFATKSKSTGRAKMYSEEEAQEHIEVATPSMRKKLFIEAIPGNFIRCDNYCDVKDYCLQNNPIAPKIKELIDVES